MAEQQYIELIKKIQDEGVWYRNVKSVFGYQIKCNLADGFPIWTIKKTFWRGICEELFWMMRGSTDVSELQGRGVNIWNANSTESYLKSRNLNYAAGDIGPGYGFQMRHYGADYVDCKTDYTGKGIDQLAKCVDLLKNDPMSRRIIIDLWNPKQNDEMALPPCHMIYNFNVRLYDSVINGKRGVLNCHLFQRSWDVLLGWNTTTAALLTHLLATTCDYDIGILVHSITDAHIYKDHIDSGVVDVILSRDTRRLPKLTVNKKPIDQYEFTDLTLTDYNPHPPIAIKMISN